MSERFLVSFDIEVEGANGGRTPMTRGETRKVGQIRSKVGA